jgi:hypothetical protein
MTLVSPSNVRRFVEEYELHSGGPADHLMRSYVAACEILCTIVGPKWAFRHVFGKGGEPTPFLRANSGEHLDRYKHQDRVIALADELFNLQHVPGFSARIARMQTSDVESSVAELEGAKLLVQTGIPVRFVEETGRSGSDYDLEATLTIGPVACETKCKIETTDLSAATLRNVFGTARDQLPPDQPGLVFVKIPERWVTDPAGESVMKSALAQSLKSTGRISAMVLHWEEWYQGRPNGAARVTRFRTEHNPQARTSLATFGSIVAPLRTGSWQHLAQMVLT